MSCYFYLVLLPLGPSCSECDVILVSCIVSGALLMDLFVLCVARL